MPRKGIEARRRVMVRAVGLRRANCHPGKTIAKLIEHSASLDASSAFSRLLSPSRRGSAGTFRLGLDDRLG